MTDCRNTFMYTYNITGASISGAQFTNGRHKKVYGVRNVLCDYSHYI